MFPPGGQPNPRPSGDLPPFPPNFAPRPPPPGGFPPFRPPVGFVPPPFPPTLPPSNPQQVGNGSPFPPFRPPPGSIPTRPGHPGLGLPPLPAGLPPPPHLSQSTSSPSPGPSFVREVKTTSVFVGGIAPGISDEALKDMLNACGPLHELKRVSGASGKPQAFGFALFESPEVVMRCLRCLNGVELPDLTPEGRRDGKPPKPLVVKVDDKTREFLEEFEQTLGRSDDEENTDAMCRKAVAHIVARLTDPNAPGPNTPTPGAPPPPREAPPVVPIHLQDLKEGDLPEEQRTVVLDQIASFRVTSFKRKDQEKKIQEEKERFRTIQAQVGRSPASRTSAPSADYGYGNRAFARETQATVADAHQVNGGPKHHDPQGYSKPVSFVKAQQSGAKAESELDDEEEEELRRQRRSRERDTTLRERERRVEARERQRIDSLNRELALRKQQAELELRNRQRLLDLFDNWDDDEVAERGRELFFADRTRWRAQRQQARQREYQDDVRDRQQEEDELRALEKESEEFLKRQMAEMAELEAQQKRKGLLTEDAAPIRLAIQPQVVPKADITEPVKHVKPAISFDNDDDEDPNQTRKRTLIRLEDDSINNAQQLAKRNAKLLEIKSQLPRDQRDLWKEPIEWAAISENLIRQKIRPFIEKQMNDFLGDVDDDLMAFVLEQIRERKSVTDLVDGLEPVLAEEASGFAYKIWQLLAFESAAHAAGLETGQMLP